MNSEDGKVLQLVQRRTQRNIYIDIEMYIDIESNAEKHFK